MRMNEFRWLIPLPPPDAEILKTYQVTHDFYQEVQHRQDFKAYCQWYEAIAEQHRRELQKMRSDVNLLGFFLRRRRT